MFITVVEKSPGTNLVKSPSQNKRGKQKKVGKKGEWPIKCSLWLSAIYIVVCLLNITKASLSSLSFVELPRVKVKTPWSEVERNAVHKHLGNLMRQRRVPGKEDCMRTIQAETALGGRSWKDVKNFVYNTIVTLNRRDATRKLKYWRLNILYLNCSVPTLNVYLDSWLLVFWLICSGHQVLYSKTVYILYLHFTFHYS